MPACIPYNLLDASNGAPHFALDRKVEDGASRLPYKSQHENTLPRTAPNPGDKSSQWRNLGEQTGNFQVSVSRDVYARLKFRGVTTPPVDV